MRPFCGFSIIDCYQIHDLLGFTHVLITKSDSCIYGVWISIDVILCYELLFRISIVKKAVVDVALYNREFGLVKFGFDHLVCSKSCN